MSISNSCVTNSCYHPVRCPTLAVCLLCVFDECLECLQSVFVYFQLSKLKLLLLCSIWCRKRKKKSWFCPSDVKSRNVDAAPSGLYSQISKEIQIEETYWLTKPSLIIIFKQSNILIFTTFTHFINFSIFFNFIILNVKVRFCYLKSPRPWVYIVFHIFVFVNLLVFLFLTNTLVMFFPTCTTTYEDEFRFSHLFHFCSFKFCVIVHLTYSLYDCANINKTIGRFRI